MSQKKSKQNLKQKVQKLQLNSNRQIKSRCNGVRKDTEAVAFLIILLDLPESL